MELSCDGRPLKTDARNIDYSKCKVFANGDVRCDDTPFSVSVKSVAVGGKTMPGYFAQGGAMVKMYDPNKYDWINGCMATVINS